MGLAELKSHHGNFRELVVQRPLHGKIPAVYGLRRTVYNISKRALFARAMVKNKCRVAIPSLSDFQSLSDYGRYSAIS